MMTNLVFVYVDNTLQRFDSYIYIFLGIRVLFITASSSLQSCEQILNEQNYLYSNEKLSTKTQPYSVKLHAE